MRSWPPSFSTETTSWPARLAKRVRSSSAAGSSLNTSRTSPTSMASMPRASGRAARGSTGRCSPGSVSRRCRRPSGLLSLTAEASSAPPRPDDTQLIQSGFIAGQTIVVNSPLFTSATISASQWQSTPSARRRQEQLLDLPVQRRSGRTLPGSSGTNRHVRLDPLHTRGAHPGQPAPTDHAMAVPGEQRARRSLIVTHTIRETRPLSTEAAGVAQTSHGGGQHEVPS